MKRFFPFLLSCFLSLTVFFIPWGFCFFEKEEAVKIENPVILPKEKNSLVMIEEKGKPLLFAVITINKDRMEIFPLSPSYMAEDTEGILPLFKIEANGGIKFVSKALERTLGINFQNYFPIDLPSLQDILSFFGSSDFSLSFPILSKEGALLFKEGRHLLKGENAILIFKEAGNLKEEERLNILTDIIVSVFNERGALSNREKEEIFNIAANHKDATLSIKDFLSWDKYNLFGEGFTFARKK